MKALHYYTGFLLTVFGVSLLLSKYFNTTLCYVVCYMRYCQVVLHLPILGTPLTSNLMFFCRDFLDFPKMNIFGQIWDIQTNFEQFDFDMQFKLRNTIPD